MKQSRIQPRDASHRNFDTGDHFIMMVMFEQMRVVLGSFVVCAQICQQGDGVRRSRVALCDTELCDAGHTAGSLESQDTSVPVQTCASQLLPATLRHSDTALGIQIRPTAAASLPATRIALT